MGYKNWFHMNSITSTVVPFSQIPRENFAFGLNFTWQNCIWLNSKKKFGFSWIPRENRIWSNFKWMLDLVEFQEKIAFNWIWRENYCIWLNYTENTDCWKLKTKLGGGTDITLLCGLITQLTGENHAHCVSKVLYFKVLLFWTWFLHIWEEN